jgi:hypothetical protein
LDRLAAHNTTGVYTVELLDIKVLGQAIPHYLLVFFLIENGTARRLAPAGWTSIEVVAWIPKERYRAMVSLVLGTVESIQLSMPSQPESTCWPTPSRTGS